MLMGCAADSRATSGLTSAVAQSATTLAEDVRQLAEWCRTAEGARDATDARIEQLEHAPMVQKQLEQLQDEVGHAACAGQLRPPGAESAGKAAAGHIWDFLAQLAPPVTGPADSAAAGHFYKMFAS